MATVWDGSESYLAWIFLIIFYIIAFYVSVNAKKVYDNCPVSSENEDIGKETAKCSIAFTSLSLIFNLALIIWVFVPIAPLGLVTLTSPSQKKCKFNGILGVYDAIARSIEPLKSKEYAKRTIPFFITLLTCAILCTLLSIAFSAASQFEGEKTATECDNTMVELGEVSSEEYNEAKESLYKTNGIMIMLIILAIIGFIFFVYQVIMCAKDGQYKAQFGRRRFRRRRL